MLLETLVCLAILGILFPITQKYVLFLHQKFQKARLRLQAVQVAYAGLSHLEARLELKNTGENYEELSARSETEFSVKSEIQQAELMLQKMTVQVEWQYRGEPETYALNEFYIPAQKIKKNDISS